MTATATITGILCVRHATGTDDAVNQALAGLVGAIGIGELGGLSLSEFVKRGPGVVEAIDTARSDPDQLYLTTDTSGGLEKAVWPQGGGTVEMQAGQSVAPGLSLPVTSSQSVSLWEYDTVSGDDLLGSVTIMESEAGAGEIAKLAKSEVESSFYYVTYSVQ
ncbi:hypothetical protein [Phytohabitans houttuyneae]|jgi:hypothetical protein|uniref:Uncharacterized protein n=1 Tax=Phytohabitans houttuyneae TaxID=1076126 RepID=A0A6V8KGP6_9ACTN|nr:hypothetical protein [Phytohabitans houttuyneae]GFJ82550.1 hypothetical protein Phou_067300 [Phytohabitans houttuyneae]